MTVNEDGRPTVGQWWRNVETGADYVVVNEDPLTLERRYGPFTVAIRRPRPQTLARAYRRVR